MSMDVMETRECPECGMSDQEPHKPDCSIPTYDTYTVVRWTRLRDADRREFGNLDNAGDAVIRLQGGTTVLTPYGCTYCGNAFWTEADRQRRLPPGLHPCPHCGALSRVTDNRGGP